MKKGVQRPKHKRYKGKGKLIITYKPTTHQNIVRSTESFMTRCPDKIIGKRGRKNVASATYNGEAY